MEKEIVVNNVGGLTVERKMEIKRDDLHPEIASPGETVLVLQRNAKDDRSPKSEDFGALIPEQAKQAEDSARVFFDQVFADTGEEEKSKIRILVVASDASLPRPDGGEPHKRAVDTAVSVISGIKESMRKFDVSDDQLLNEVETTSGTPIEMSGLTDLLIFKDSPEFVDFLKKKYGFGKDFWVKLEEDADITERAGLGAEGPSDVADRMRRVLSALVQECARKYHQADPGTRLYIWAVSHYDSISPLVKDYIYNKDPAKAYLPVEQGSGIVIKLDKDGVGKTTINGETHLAVFLS